MKIIERTATELKIQTRGVFDFWLHSCLLIVIGLKWVAFDCHFATLTCRRIQATQGNCQLVRSGWLGAKVQKIQLAALQEAKVVKSGYTSRVVLVTDAGHIPFDRSYIHWGNKDSTAAQINSFVKNWEQKWLELKQHDSLFEWLGGLLVTAGIAVIALGKKEIYSFDRTLDVLIVKRQGLLGTQVIKHSLHEIYGVEVAYLRDRNDEISYQLNLLRKNGDRLSLPSTVNQYKQQQVAKAINNFLNARSS